MLIFDKNQSSNPRTQIILSQMQMHIYDSKVFTLLFGTFIYRHISLRKPRNSKRKTKPKDIKHKIISRRKSKTQKYRNIN